MKKFLTLIILTAILFSGCGIESRQITSVEDLKHARIGCWPECGYEFAARKVLPDAQYVYLDFVSDLVQNLKQNKIDAFVIAESYVENLKLEGVDVDYLPENLGDVPTSYIFAKNEKGQQLCAQMNEFLKQCEADGTLTALDQKWIHSDETQRTFTKSKLSGENGTLKVGTDAASSPFVYLRGTEPVGFEVELFDKFCATYGYDYEIKVELFETMLVDMASGKLDAALDAIEIMPEREQSMLFANPTYIQKTVAVINSDAITGKSFLDETKDRIAATIIIEDRWKMFFSGIFSTLTITFSSMIFGTLLGFAVYMLYREKIKPVNKIINTVIQTLQGLPTMVLLLFFYYIVFGSVDVPAIFVAVVVFSILLSVSVFVMLKSGAESISKGQTEAALSLGFSERRAFVKFILPQVIRIFFPSYRLALNTLLLETAIVGYIAVQDLTRIADLIRARTYDAFLPIIIISIIYLLLSWLLKKFADNVAIHFDPKTRRREDILKGVKL